MKTLQVKSTRQIEMIDISEEVCNIINESGLTKGLAVVFTPHTTAAVTINENADPDVCRDLVMAINKKVATPPNR